MHKVKVYYFKQYDIASDSEVFSRRPATLEAISRIDGATAFENTGAVVDASDLDGNGFLLAHTQ